MKIIFHFSIAEPKLDSFILEKDKNSSSQDINEKLVAVEDSVVNLSNSLSEKSIDELTDIQLKNESQSVNIKCENLEDSVINEVTPSSKSSSLLIEESTEQIECMSKESINKDILEVSLDKSKCKPEVKNIIPDEQQVNAISKNFEENSSPKIIYLLDSKLPENGPRKCKTLDISVNKIKSILQSKKYNESELEISNKFKAKINPSDNNQAEEELKKCISKDSFSEVSIFVF